MIRLEIEGYCQSCLDFCPDVIKPQRVSLQGETTGWTDTVIQCEYHKRCQSIKRYLEQQMKGEQEAVG
jgi:hypothetical protein